MPTIHDVARAAAVSIATVSHVINASRHVAPETRKRVMGAIKALNYRPHGVARSLRRSRTGTIGVVISDITNPYFSDLVRGIEDTVYSLDGRHNFILCNTEEDAEKEQLYLEVLLEKRVDGLIVSPAGGNIEYLNGLRAEGMPMVFVDRTLAGVDADTVAVDNRAAARNLVAHLIGVGHRRIAAMKARLNADTIEDRIAGYFDALKDGGVAGDAADLAESSSGIEDAHRVGCRLLTCGKRPDAIFCTNNFMTLGMMQAITQAGLRCPEDIALAGFDDFPWATAFRPRLTVVAQPSYAIGCEAVRLLFDRISKRRIGPAVKLTLATRLIVRDSCGHRT